MKRSVRSHTHVLKHSKSIDWLPIDSRIIPNILSFGHVQGFAKLFLQIEIVLALVVVVGAITMMVLRIFNVA
jgi:hypothetical protein